VRVLVRLRPLGTFAAHARARAGPAPADDGGLRDRPAG